VELQVESGDPGPEGFARILPDVDGDGYGELVFGSEKNSLSEVYSSHGAIWILEGEELLAGCLGIIWRIFFIIESTIMKA
jgi:hypothetical protein